MGDWEMRFSKWDGAPHWHFDVEQLGTDGHGVWFAGPPGTRLQRGEEPRIVESRGFVMLVPRAAWWIAFWNHHDDDLTVYVDVTTVSQVADKKISAVDLDLDVVRWRDESVEVLDADEFEQHQVDLDYPPEVIAEAEATSRWLCSRLTRRTEPFGIVGETWLDRAAAVWL